jgi:hypothetical protein
VCGASLEGQRRHALRRVGWFPDTPYEWRCDISHATTNATSTTKIIMNTTQRAQTLLSIIANTPFSLRKYVSVRLPATGKYGTVTVANYGPEDR